MRTSRRIRCFALALALSSCTVFDDLRLPTDAGVATSDAPIGVVPDSDGYRREVLHDSPLAYWRLGEGTGSEFGPAEKVTFRDIAARAAAATDAGHFASALVPLDGSDKHGSTAPMTLDEGIRLDIDPARVAAIAQPLAPAFGNELVEQLAAEAKRRLGVTINKQLVDQLRKELTGTAPAGE